MRGSVKKSALILGVLLLSIAAAGQVFPGRDSQADVPVVTERVLVPGGQSVGVRMDVRGVLVVGLEEIENETGEKINPGLVSGLQIGDTILSINGTKVSSADEVQTLVNEIRDTVKLKVKRNGQKITVTVKPVLSKKDGLYKLGIWVKDKTAGIGTLTYYDPANNTFGALGHGIVDVETNSILPVESGQLLQSQVQEVKEGRDGSPGATGATPRFTVTAVTGEAGTAASVTQSGTAENPMVEFTIPQGMKGDTGATGEKGEKGDPGKDAPQEIVLYTAQTLNDAQKTQARENIGAADEETVNQLKDDKVNQSDALTLEEIMASTDLSKKVASAEAVKSIKNAIGSIKSGSFYAEKSKGNTVPVDYGGFIRLSGGSWPGSFYSDTYYVGVGAGSEAFLGVQINGAKQITWVKI